MYNIQRYSGRHTDFTQQVRKYDILQNKLSFPKVLVVNSATSQGVVATLEIPVEEDTRV